MFYDAAGRPSPDGDYELINGKLCIRDGRKIHFDVMLWDSAPSRPPQMIDDSARAAMLAATGRAPIRTTERVKAVADQIAHEHAEKQRENDAYVREAIKAYAPRTRLQQDASKLADAAAVRDAAFASQYR